MDILRQSVMRAQLAKPLPGGIPSREPHKVSDTRSMDMAVIDARFAVVNEKLDTLIQMLKGPDHRAARRLVGAEVRQVVSDYFHVNKQDLNGRKRFARSARIRQIAYYLCRMHTACSLPEIGQIFHRDHATILHGVRRIGSLRETDATLQNDLLKLEARLADIRTQRNAA